MVQDKDVTLSHPFQQMLREYILRGFKTKKELSQLQKQLNKIRYADDTVILAENFRPLARTEKYVSKRMLKLMTIDEYQ